MRYHVDLSLTRPNDNMPIFLQKFDKSRPNYPTDVRDNVRNKYKNEASLTRGWHFSTKRIFWNACKPLITYLTYLICIKTYALYAYCIICIINNAHYTYMHNISVAKAAIWHSKATHCLCLHFARLNIWINILIKYKLLNWHEPLITYLTKPMLNMHNPSLSCEN